MKKFKVTYQVQTGLHSEQKSIEVFSPNVERAKTTALMQLYRKGEYPVIITENWAKVEQI